MASPATGYDPDPPGADPPPPIYMEAVTVCDGYHDYLRYTLPHNKPHFDHMVVVTSYEDKATQRICEFNEVECLKTDRIESRKGVFCKGCGINDGLKALKMKGWMVHIDADIALPPRTRDLIQRANLNPAMIYGIDRFIVKGATAWHAFLEMPALQHECDSYVHLNAFPMGTRFMQPRVAGYVPIGFFQLWNPLVSKVKRYFESNTDAGRTDQLFASRWPRAMRGFIPELVGYHLETDDSGFGANWKGRVTSPFSIISKEK